MAPLKKIVEVTAHQYPRYWGSHKAKGGKKSTASMLTIIASTSHHTHGKVCSIDTPAILHETMRLTAIGGVNWPTATIMVSKMPNHTGSH